MLDPLLRWLIRVANSWKDTYAKASIGDLSPES